MALIEYSRQFFFDKKLKSSKFEGRVTVKVSELEVSVSESICEVENAC